MGVWGRQTEGGKAPSCEASTSRGSLHRLQTGGGCSHLTRHRSCPPRGLGEIQFEILRLIHLHVPYSFHVRDLILALNTFRGFIRQAEPLCIENEVWPHTGMGVGWTVYVRLLLLFRGPRLKTVEQAVGEFDVEWEGARVDGSRKTNRNPQRQ